MQCAHNWQTRHHKEGKRFCAKLITKQPDRERLFVKIQVNIVQHLRAGIDIH